MTAEIVNLRRVRKAKARAGREALAREHRARFGRSRPERLRADAERERALQELDGARLAKPASGEAPRES